MQFTNPIALWGLTGLLIPIGIHLLSLKVGKIFKIGSIRHLDDTNTRQFKSIRLNETGLLAIRCLLIASVVFLLSGLHFPFIEENENWLVIEKGLEKDGEFSSLIDSLQENNYKTKSLAKGFPELNDSATAEEKINYWQLIDDLKAKPLNNVVVLSYNYLKGFNGRQAYLSDNIQWLTRTPNAVTFPLYAIRLSKDSVFVRTGKSNGEETSFKSTREFAPSGDNYAQSVEVESLDTISISIISDSAFSTDKLIINTAVNVLDENNHAVLHVHSSTGSNFPSEKKIDWIIWLSERSLSPTLQANSIRFSDKGQAGNLLFLENHREGYSSWILSKRLNAEIALEENLTLQLGQILFPSKKYPKRIQEFDRRVLPEKIAWHKTTTLLGEKKVIVPTSSSGEILAALILIILAIERFVTFKRNQ